MMPVKQLKQRNCCFYPQVDPQPFPTTRRHLQCEYLQLLSLLASLCLSCFLCLSISVYLCLSLSVSSSLPPFLSLSPSLCLPLSLSLFPSLPLFLPPTISLSVSISVSLSLCFFLSLSLSPSLSLFSESYNRAILSWFICCVFRSDSDFPSPTYRPASDKSSVKSIGGELLADYMNKVAILCL